jgi:hypothetical protein
MYPYLVTIQCPYGPNSNPNSYRSSVVVYTNEPSEAMSKALSVASYGDPTRYSVIRVQRIEPEEAILV